MSIDNSFNFCTDSQIPPSPAIDIRKWEWLSLNAVSRQSMLRCPALLGDYSKFQYLWSVEENISLSSREQSKPGILWKGLRRALVGSLQVPHRVQGWLETSTIPEDEFRSLQNFKNLKFHFVPKMWEGLGPCWGPAKQHMQIMWQPTIAVTEKGEDSKRVNWIWKDWTTSQAWRIQCVENPVTVSHTPSYLSSVPLAPFPNRIPL